MSEAKHTAANTGYAAKRSEYFEVSDGIGVEFRSDAEPDIQWNHIDGPLLHSRFGYIEWLTLRERFLCWIGRADARSLERKHWPEEAARYDLRSAQAKAGGRS